MSSRFRSVISEAQYIESWKKRRGAAGKLLSRKNLGLWWHHKNADENVLFKFKAKFEKKTGIEAILCVKDLDDTWRVEKYSLE